MKYHKEQTIGKVEDYPTKVLYEAMEEIYDKAYSAGYSDARAELSKVRR